MKKYPISQFSEETWRALSLLFRRGKLECLPDSHVFDTIEAELVETTKLGIEVRGAITFLDHGRYPATLLLARPRFSLMGSFTAEQVEAAGIRKSELNPDGSLWVEIA